MRRKKSVRDVILYGDREGGFEGVVKILERRYRETESEEARREIEFFMAERPCPACRGARLRRESLGLQIAGKSIADGVRLLKDRECVGGGWNYGNRVVYGVDLPPYVQTTAAALLALQGSEPDVVDRGRRLLLEHWQLETGGLSLALTLAALQLTGGAPTDAIMNALEASFDATSFLGNVVAIAWATVATGPGLERLRLAAP